MTELSVRHRWGFEFSTTLQGGGLGWREPVLWSSSQTRHSYEPPSLQSRLATWDAAGEGKYQITWPGETYTTGDVLLQTSLSTINSTAAPEGWDLSRHRNHPWGCCGLCRLPGRQRRRRSRESYPGEVNQESVHPVLPDLIHPPWSSSLQLQINGWNILCFICQATVGSSGAWLYQLCHQVSWGLLRMHAAWGKGVYTLSKYLVTFSFKFLFNWIYGVLQSPPSGAHLGPKKL